MMSVLSTWSDTSGEFSNREILILLFRKITLLFIFRFLSKANSKHFLCIASEGSGIFICLVLRKALSLELNAFDIGRGVILSIYWLYAEAQLFALDYLSFT